MKLSTCGLDISEDLCVGMRAICLCVYKQKAVSCRAEPTCFGRVIAKETSDDSPACQHAYNSLHSTDPNTFLYF